MNNNKLKEDILRMNKDGLFPLVEAIQAQYSNSIITYERLDGGLKRFLKTSPENLLDVIYKAIQDEPLEFIAVAFKNRKGRLIIIPIAANIFFYKVSYYSPKVVKSSDLIQEVLKKVEQYRLKGDDM